MQITQKIQKVDQAKAATSGKGLPIQAAGVVLFGLLVVLAVGFAPSDAVHSAAHDTRHAFAFPCH